MRAKEQKKPKLISEALRMLFPPVEKTVGQTDTDLQASEPPLSPQEADNAEISIGGLKPDEAGDPTPVPNARVAAPASPEQAKVHVAPNLLHLLAGVLATPEEAQAAKRQRELDRVVHRMLVVGLVISTFLMLTGLALDFILQREMPTQVPTFGEALGRVIVGRPSGFLTLGLLVLIATPVLRVVGSIFAFMYERDWHFAGITFLVLGVVAISLMLGKG